ncbi:TPA: hypothetical protein L1197_003351 [Escherichia coli]|nr:hypothetical protein [Escherichia coli]HBN1649719.1 hypothetical protein [Escherichia coli]HBN2107733.1 hypothetical protein [Escherichia coli]HDS8664509.1 hypothetical protein [Escherichia coli]
MRKTIIATLALTTIAATPAHAISAKYREQLERSGCTQMNAGTTCDIHKSKAQNAAKLKPQVEKHARELRVIGEDILGLQLSAARQGLAYHGFKETDAKGVWLNDTGDTLRIGTNSHGVINRVDINK